MAKFIYEIDQRKVSNLQVTVEDGKVYTFSNLVSNTSRIKKLEESPILERMVKAGYLVKHLPNNKVATSKGIIDYAEYAKALKKIKKSPLYNIEKDAKKEVKEEAKAETKEVKAETKEVKAETKEVKAETKEAKAETKEAKAENKKKSKKSK